MKKKKQKSALRIAGIILLIVLVLFIAVPYLFPISVHADSTDLKPFDNSSMEVVNGVSFHYRTYRPADNAINGKLMLVHGLAGSTFSFEEAAPLIAEQGYCIVSVDLPGFGYSDRNPSYDHSQANRAKDLWQLLSIIDQGLPRELAELPWNLAGHSMGGGAVASMAYQNELRTESLILIDAALFEEPRSGDLLNIPPLKQWVQVALEYFLITENNIKNLLASAYGKDPTVEQVKGYLQPLRLPGTVRSFTNMIKTSKNEDPARLGGLSAGILAIWGGRDTWVPAVNSEKLKLICPNASIVIIDDAGHCPMETHTEAFCKAVLNWLSSSKGAGL